MNKVETRLRQELPELAEALVAAAPASHREGTNAVGGPPGDIVMLDLVSPPGRGQRRSRLATLVAAVALAVVATTAVLLTSSDDPDRLAVATTPVDFGSWTVISEGPLATRVHAVSAWTGTEAVFWAGTNVARNFAYTDGAVYDPSSDTWRDLVVPGWGHPGLTSAYLGGEVYTVAKGGATSFDPVQGRWQDLAHFDGVLLSAIVATSDAVWGLGPVEHNPQGGQRMAIARYDAADDAWIEAATFAVPEAQAAIVDALIRLEATTLWTGEEIVVWAPQAGGLAFDPTADVWRIVEPLRANTPGEAGERVGALAAQTSFGLAVLAEGGASGEAAIDKGATTADLAIMTDDGWRWTGAEVPFTDFDSVTVSGAGEWIVAFSADDAPVTIHVPTGAWKRHDGAPIGGRIAPNLVWTGTSLVVWGGDAVAADQAAGVMWVPPAS